MELQSKARLHEEKSAIAADRELRRPGPNLPYQALKAMGSTNIR
jgi:hypothetical protein